MFKTKIIASSLKIHRFFLKSAMFGFSGERLTRRIRSMGFQKMLTQEIGWYDRKENNVGVLCTKLSVDAAAVQGVINTDKKFFCAFCDLLIIITLKFRQQAYD